MKRILLFLVFVGNVYGNQTKNLYDAEAVLVNKKGIYFMNRSDAARFLNVIFEDQWFKSRYNIKMPIVVRSEREGWAYSVIGNGVGKIAIPDKGCWNYNVLHELAHHLTPKNSHEKEFAKTEIILIEHFINANAAKALRKSFKEKGVQF